MGFWASMDLGFWASKFPWVSGFWYLASQGVWPVVSGLWPVASGVSFRATHPRLRVAGKSVFSLWGLFFDSFFHQFSRSTFLPLKFTTCDQKAPKMTSKGPHFDAFWWVDGIHGNPCFTIVKHRFLRFWEVPFHDFCVTFFMVSTFSHSI